jgi:hypothetical protein
MMTRDYVLDQLRQPGPIVGGVLLALTLVVLVVRGVRRFVRSERPDDLLSNLAMLMGFGWSSEAVWVLAGPTGANLPTPIRWSLFVIFEVIMTVFMIRARRNMKLLQHPGRAGRIAWVVAAGMSLVAVTTAHNLGEAFLRLLVPFLLTAMWWDGLVGEGIRQAQGATSWRWTPRRLLLWLGAVEPGERDVETVNRERVTQQMTRLEYRRRHGWKRLAGRRAGRLARLSLTADDDMIAAVQQRVGRATWFEATQPGEPAAASPARITAAAAASARAARVRHGRPLRTVRVTHPRTPVAPVQEARQDDRATHEIDTLIRVLKDAIPASPNRQIARLACVSEPTVRRALRRTRAAEPAQSKPVNGHRVDLEGVTQ